MWYTGLIAFFSLPVLVWSLSCYICGDNNLDEFGECSAQFQYDCQSYALRFPHDEIIYCRTTRHKAPNNTYTIMKECISQQDHYHTFPSKGYSIDEECDLIEVQGEEVAYCICRSHNFCNKDSIADQFIAFEEKNPELFGDVDLAHSSSEDPAAIPQPSRIDFSTPPLRLPPIIPVNDPRADVPGIESEIRRAQLPTREKTIDFSGSSDELSLSEEPHQTLAHGQGTFIGSTGINRHAVAVPAPVPAGKTPAKPTGLRCSQCGESDLRSENSDCNRQVVVHCNESDAVCFTRQTLLGRGKAAVEKMCASLQAVKAEFPTSSVNSCGEANQRRVRYCTCDDNECNSMAILLQMTRNSQTEALPRFIKIAPPASQPPSATPELPEKRPSPAGDHLSVQHPHEESLSERRKSSSDITSSQENLMKGEKSLLALQPIIPAPPSGNSGIELTTGKPRSTPAVGSQDAIEPILPQQSVLRCSVCVESGMSDPTADCSSSVPAHCSSYETFCLTRQTQNEDATFTMEKRCVSETQVVSLVESSEVRTGCATANGGLINYCICQGDLCNHDALLVQAQISGVRVPEKQPKSTDPTIQRKPEKIGPLHSSSTSSPDFIFDNEEAAHVETSTAPAIRMIEDDELMMRQKVWAEADLTRSSSFNLPASIAMVFSLLLL